MSDDQMFDRNARAWLHSGPSAAPKRVVDEALRTIASIPQQRDLRAPWRLPHLTLNIRFAAVAAVALAVVGAGLLMWRSPQNRIGNPSPSPTASPLSSGLTLEMLQGAWASVGTRDDPIGDHSNPPLVESMVIDATGLRIQSFVEDMASSGSIVSADGQLRLRMDAPQELLTRRSWECTTGDNGTYFASLSADQQTLTLASAGDDCATRRDILTGDWTRWPCRDLAQYSHCDHVSELAPGRYVAALFRPFHNGTTGQLAYTLPAGWAKHVKPPTWPGPGDPEHVWLTRVDAPDVQAIGIFANLHPSDPQAVPDGLDLSCQSGTGLFGTAAQTADFLESQPFLSVSGRRAVVIGGLAGVQIDVSLISGFVDPCSWSTDSAGKVTYSTDIEIFQNAANDPDIYLDSAGDAFARFILLDGPGPHVVIQVSAPDQTSLDARLADAMPVIESFEFIQNPGSSPTPASSPTAVSAADLQATWTSVGTRPIPGALDQMTVFTLGANYLDIQQPDGDLRNSWVLIDGMINRIWVHGPLGPDVAERWDCFGIGEYDVSLSTNRATLSLTAIDEDCDQRAAILAGDWTRDVAAEASPT